MQFTGGIVTSILSSTKDLGLNFENIRCVNLLSHVLPSVESCPELHLQVMSSVSGIGKQSCSHPPLFIVHADGKSGCASGWNNSKSPGPDNEPKTSL